MAIFELLPVFPLAETFVPSPTLPEPVFQFDVDESIQWSGLTFLGYTLIRACHDLGKRYIDYLLYKDG